MLQQSWWSHKNKLSEGKGENLRKADDSCKKYKKSIQKRTYGIFLEKFLQKNF